MDESFEKILTMRVRGAISFPKTRGIVDYVTIGLAAMLFLLYMAEAGEVEGWRVALKLIVALTWLGVGVLHTYTTHPRYYVDLPEMTLDDARGLRDCLNKAIAEGERIDAAGAHDAAA